MRQFPVRRLLSLTLTGGALAQPLVPIDQAAWTSDGAYLVTARGRQLQVLDGQDGHLVKAASVPGEKMVYISFSPDSGREEPNWLSGMAVAGRYALTGGGDHMLHWWIIPELEVVAKYEASYGLTGLSLGGQGKVGGYTDSSTRDLDASMMIVRWNSTGEDGSDSVTASSLPDLIQPYSSETFGVPQVSPGGEWALGRVDETVRLWQLGGDQVTSQELPGLTMDSLRLGASHFYRLTKGAVEQYAYSAPTVVVRSFETTALDAAVDEDETRLVLWTGKSIVLWSLLKVDPAESWEQTCEGVTLCPDGGKVLLHFKERFEAWDFQGEKELFEIPRAKVAR
jgi:hypothetical protein